MNNSFQASSIRIAQLSDLRDILRNELASQINPWREQSVLESFNSEHLIWVMQHHQEIVGHMFVLPILDEWELLNLAVAPQHQGNGLGSHWISFLIAQAQLQQIESVFLEVRESNSAAIGLYEKHAFQLIGNRKNYYPSGTGREDALIMQLSIAK